MTLNRIALASLLSLSVVAAAACGGQDESMAATSAATTVNMCQADIADLKAKTLAVTFTNSIDQVGLVGKLDAAASKLSLAKNADAIQKLTDYQTKVLSLIATGKIAPSADGLVTPQMLVDGSAAAIACIQAIGLP